jgi:hypothetical protein
VPLVGGIANAGSVTRDGAHVLRPSNIHTPSIHRFLATLDAAGFDGASSPVGVDADGRERLVFIEGDVAFVPYPRWVQADDTLASIAVLLRRFHEAAHGFDRSGSTWSGALADPAGGPVVCHNDVCLENVVFRAGQAVGLIDFDYAAPGRPLYDLAHMVRMCVPLEDDTFGSLIGWDLGDRPARLRLAVDAYGLGAPERRQLGELLALSIDRAEAFVRGRAEAGDPNFLWMWKAIGGQERFDRKRRWWQANRAELLRALA